MNPPKKGGNPPSKPPSTQAPPKEGTQQPKREDPKRSSDAGQSSAASGSGKNTLTEQAASLNKVEKEYAGRFKPTFTSQDIHKRVVGLATKTAVGLDVVADNQHGLEQSLEYHRQQDAKDKSQTVGDIAEINQKLRANEAKTLATTQSSATQEFLETESSMDASLKKTVSEMSGIILRSLLKNEVRVAKLAKLDKDRKTVSDEKQTMVVEHQNQSAKEGLNTRIAKHMARETKDYTAARAQLELNKLNEDARYIPLLPPGKEWKLWDGKEIWMKILCRFLEIIAQHIGEREEWPAKFDSKSITWATNLRKPMKDLLAPFYEKYADEIINLGGAILDKKSDFGEAILQLANKTFIKHYDDGEASTYYIPFYAGTIHLLHILKEMQLAEANQEPQQVVNEPEIIDQDPESSVKWTSKLMWQRMGDMFAAEFEKDEYEQGNVADVGGAAAGQQDEVNEPPASTGGSNGKGVRRRGLK